MAARIVEDASLEEGRLQGVAELRSTLMDVLTKAEANGKVRISTRDVRLLVSAAANVTREHQAEDADFLAMVARTLVGREKKAD